MSSSSNWKFKSSNKFEKILFLCHVNSMQMHATMKKTRLCHKKWATLPCNHHIAYGVLLLSSLQDPCNLGIVLMLAFTSGTIMFMSLQ
jgi:sulfite exporter TauE/SafE